MEKISTAIMEELEYNNEPELSGIELKEKVLRNIKEKKKTTNKRNKKKNKWIPWLGKNKEKNQQMSESRTSSRKSSFASNTSTRTSSSRMSNRSTTSSPTQKISSVSLLSDALLSESVEDIARQFLITPSDIFTDKLAMLKRSTKKKKERLKMISGMSPEDIKSYKEAFNFCDRNGDGTIDQGELLYVMRMIGENPTEDQISSIMLEMDEDGNGKIDFEEFLISMAERNKMRNSQEDLRMAFQVFDLDGNGQISLEELMHVMTTISGAMTVEEATEFMTVADTDGNGYIDYKEFVDAIS